MISTLIFQNKIDDDNVEGKRNEEFLAFKISIIPGTMPT